MTIERLHDIAVVNLEVDGFDDLTKKQKLLAFHLSNAGLHGRAISLSQSSEHNIALINALVEIYESADENLYIHNQVKESLFILFAHGGLYHSTTGHILNLPLDREVLLSYRHVNKEAVETIDKILFGEIVPTYRTVQNDLDENGNKIDIVQSSGANFYNGLTLDEVNEFRDHAYPKHENDEVPPYGFNERLVKTDSGIVRETIYLNGLHSSHIQKIIQHLIKAKEYAENKAQFESISTLIKFYETGLAKDFDEHCIAWVKDTESSVYFVNGLIESYNDPLGVACDFESIVAFKNPSQTAKVNKIIENIQWFEDSMPFDNRFKKEKANGLSASSITVISMAGESSPSLPLGINLPNSDWIREKHGSKSVNLSNVASSRSASEAALREELYLPEYSAIIAEYKNSTDSLHTDLHEIAGHGSGKMVDGLSTEAIGAYYSVIEETRADLVGLFFLPEDNLKTFGIYDDHIVVADAAKAHYISYLTNGAFGQLRRIEIGKDLTQAHFRNRQLISNWVLAHADPSKVSMVTQDDKEYIKVNDVSYLQGLFGELLSIVQEIKSTADFDRARDLVLTYGTKVDQKLHASLLRRMKKLNLPAVICYNTPILSYDGQNVTINQPQSFFEQQLELHKEFSSKP